MLAVASVTWGADGPPAPRVEPVQSSEAAHHSDAAEFEGEYWGALGERGLAGAHVVHRHDRWSGVIYAKGLPGGGWDGRTSLTVEGALREGQLHITGTDLTGTIRDGWLLGRVDNVDFRLHKIERRSPTRGYLPPKEAVVAAPPAHADENSTDLSPDAPNAAGHETGRRFHPLTETPWAVFLPATGRGNYQLHAEFQFAPRSSDHEGACDLPLPGAHVLRLVNSFGTGSPLVKRPWPTCGTMDGTVTPLIDMCLPPKAWQTLDVEFTETSSPDEPEAGRVAVRLNGVMIHRDVPLLVMPPHAAPPAESVLGHPPAAPTPGPIEGNGAPTRHFTSPVRFRNVWRLDGPVGSRK